MAYEGYGEPMSELQYEHSQGRFPEDEQDEYLDRYVKVKVIESFKDRDDDQGFLRTHRGTVEVECVDVGTFTFKFRYGVYGGKEVLLGDPTSAHLKMSSDLARYVRSQVEKELSF